MHRLLLFLSVLVAMTSAAAMPPAGDTALPERLSDTGLFEPGTLTVRGEILAFSPQYALWSDGAGKRRWLYLPAGAAIDGSNPDAWEFPPGTRLWKEFSHAAPVETRMVERLADGSWRYATYVWTDDGSDALLAPERGLPRHAVTDAPDGRYPIPSQQDCVACHEGAAVPVLGFSAVQLPLEHGPPATQRSEAIAGDIDLRTLIERGLLRGFPLDFVDRWPGLPSQSDVERAALGYLHANCGHCHNDTGALPVDMILASKVSGGRAFSTLINRRSDEAVAGQDRRVVPRHPESSVLALRMATRDARLQMPPLGTRIVDAEGLSLVEGWIRQITPDPQELEP